MKASDVLKKKDKTEKKKGKSNALIDWISSRKNTKSKKSWEKEDEKKDDKKEK